MNGELKLWVVGESSGDPGSWFDYASNRLLVAASCESEAEELADCGPALLVEMKRPMILSRQSYLGD